MLFLMQNERERFILTNAAHLVVMKPVKVEAVNQNA